MLVHAAMGLTLLAMAIVMVLKVERRKKYCMIFYVFAICEGIHAVPVSINNDSFRSRTTFHTRLSPPDWQLGVGYLHQMSTIKIQSERRETCWHCNKDVKEKGLMMLQSCLIYRFEEDIQVQH